MILIFTNNEDRSTNKIIEWLDFYSIDFMRINEDVTVKIINYSIQENKFILEVNGQSLDCTKIEGYWYRRGDIPIKNISFQDSSVNYTLNRLFKTDQNTLRNFIYFFLENNSKNVIGSYFRSDVNKLFQLYIAKSCGLTLPLTKVLTNFKDIDTSKKFITKSFNTVFESLSNGTTLLNYTNKIDTEINESFFSSLIQEQIDKLFEIRVFYLNGICYSMAIFSQTNSSTEVDFRRYDNVNPNRNVPFKLPKKLERSIVKYMKKINLNTGSLDFIYSKDKDFIFLEVNPIGQFGMVSHPCNYQLEELISKTLFQ